MVRIHLPCGEFFIANSGVKVTRIHPFSGVFFTSFQASGKGLFLAASGEISQQPVPHIATILRRYTSLLAREEQWKRNFCLYLGKKITAAVSGHEGALLRADSGLDKGLLAELLADVAEKEFMDNPDLADLFQGAQGDALRQECRTNLREGLSSFIDVLAEKYAFTRQVSNVVVDVEVETEKLKKMPENSIQTLHLNIAPAAVPAVLAEQNDVSGLAAQ